MSVLKPRLTTTASPDVVAPAHPCARDTDTSLCGVRRAFLCGEDRFSRVNYDHRKQWVVDRMKFLSSVFAIDICAYAVMSNHYHLALHVDETKAKSWTDGEVATRWRRLFAKDAATAGHADIDDTQVAESGLRADVVQWRARLMDIRWYMRCMNESIARASNKEDGCKGRSRTSMCSAAPVHPCTMAGSGKAGLNPKPCLTKARS